MTVVPPRGTRAATLPALRQPLDLEWVERSAVARGEPEFLRRSRRDAAARANETAWPTGQEEEWRRFPPAAIPASPLIGARSTTTYSMESLPKGAYAGDLEAAVRERPDLVDLFVWQLDKHIHPRRP